MDNGGGRTFRRSPSPKMIPLRTILFLLPLAVTPALAAPCAPGTLGTSRVMTIDAAATPRVGLKHFPTTLPLSDREVVLTFDDGPMPGTTSRVLAALAHECVRATFFLVGRNAAAYPALVRRIAAEGHTIAHHSFSHPIMSRMTRAAAEADIDRGIAAVETALHGHPSATASTPFFRFPGFASTPDLLDALERRRMVVFGADLWASDWNAMTPQAELDLVTQRLAIARRGIILFHDTRSQTAAMLPGFLRFLKGNGYRVVHVVPASP